MGLLCCIETIQTYIFQSLLTACWFRHCHSYTVFQKKTPTYIIGYKLRSCCLILIIFDTKIPHKI